MMWSPSEITTANNLGLWLGVLQGVVYEGIRERPDSFNEVSLGQQATATRGYDYVYKTMYVTDEQLSMLRELADSTNENRETINIQGVWSCTADLDESLSKSSSISGENKVIFKVQQVNPLQDIGSEWTVQRTLLNQTAMALDLQSSGNPILFFEPIMRIIKHSYDANNHLHIIEM